MAAPDSKNISDLNGKWILNAKLSDPTGPTLSLQGVGWMTQKLISAATITLHITQYSLPAEVFHGAEADENVLHINIEQNLTKNLKGMAEKRCLDNDWHEHSDWLFGKVRGKAKWASYEELGGDDLKAGWLENETEAVGPYGRTHILCRVESLERDWVANEVWGFQMINNERRNVRNVAVTSGGKVSRIRMVYDWIGFDVK
ncbi:hypothetical protein V2G26_012448 [Clonostachys chloroleuca]|uniref:LCCL domain-containing protein n=1 Tax=Clonostachys chloroleuca TaxID=1926264 RepID=A0AA35Q5U2_9HYPO|nr:unnamed protein product [Clonostachys chloroleuca]